MKTLLARARRALPALYWSLAFAAVFVISVLVVGAVNSVVR